MAVGAFAHVDELGARPRSLGNGRLTRKERVELRVLTTSLAKGRHYANRPRTLGECQERIDGPCPWVSCRHNLFIEIEDRSVKANHPGKEIDAIGETCSLRVAADGPHTLERTGELLNVTLERARQLERDALRSLRRKIEASDDYPPAFKAIVARLTATAEESATT